MGKPLQLKRLVFGPLKVWCRWGSMAAGIYWVVFCIHCGHVNKRLGSHLVNGHRVNCSQCKARDGDGVAHRSKRPDPEKLASLMQCSPISREACSAVVRGVKLRATAFTGKELEEMQEAIAKEKARRR